MSHPTPYPVKLADEIALQLGKLADHLTRLPPHQAAQAIAHVLDAESGVLGAVTHLMVTGSVFAKDQAERGALPAEVALALGRASHGLHDVALDLDEHQDVLRRFGAQPAAAVAPVPAPLVVRRHR
ncbi:hypothetical protein ACWEL8_09690 [Streptomyces sp. NPDC004690]